MERLFKFFICFVCLMFVSCERNQQMPHITDNVHQIRFDLSGSFDQNDLRSLEFSDDGEDEGIPKNKILWNKVRDLQVALILKNQSNTYILKGKGDVSKVGDDTYNIVIYAEYKSDKPVVLDNSYYVTGFIGGKVDDTGSKLNLDIPNILSKDLRNLDIPVSFPWRRLKTEYVRDNSYANIPDIKFKPIGNLIAFDITSEVYDPINIVGVNVKTNIFSSGGFFDIKNATVKEGEYIPYNVSGNTDNIDYTITAPNPTDLKLERNQNVKYFYTWVMGNKLNSTDKRELSIGFRIKPFSRDAIPNTEKENIKVFTTPYFDRWKPKSIPVFTHGKPFFIKTKVQSTHPIITEVYHNKLGWNSWGYKEQQYTVIELYNPSVYPINIRDYYLARAVGGNLYHGYTKSISTFDYSLLLPVCMSDGNTVRLPNDMNTEINEMKLLYRTYYGSSIVETLQPGKTVLILGDTYHKDLVISGKDLLIDGDNGGIGSYVKDKCWSELKSIQYIVCSDKSPRCELTPDADKSHILKFKPHMGFVLFKKVNSEPFDKEVSDVKTGGKNRFLAVDSYGPYFNSTVGENPLIQYKDQRFFVIRYDGVVFPSGGNYDPSQWKYVDNDYIKTNVDITSIGARYMSWKSSIIIPDMPSGN